MSIAVVSAPRSGSNYHKNLKEILDIVKSDNKMGDYDEDPTVTFNPHPTEWVIVWARPNNVERKRLKYGAEVVTTDDAVKIYKMDKDFIKGNHCMKLGCIMMRYSYKNWLRRQVQPALMAAQYEDPEIKRAMRVAKRSTTDGPLLAFSDDQTPGAGAKYNPKASPEERQAAVESEKELQRRYEERKANIKGTDIYSLSKLGGLPIPGITPTSATGATEQVKV